MEQIVLCAAGALVLGMVSLMYLELVAADLTVQEWHHLTRTKRRPTDWDQSEVRTNLVYGVHNHTFESTSNG